MLTDARVLRMAQRSAAAIVATMTPAIGFRSNAKNDSEEVSAPALWQPPC